MQFQSFVLKIATPPIVLFLFFSAEQSRDKTECPVINKDGECSRLRALTVFSDKNYKWNHIFKVLNGRRLKQMAHSIAYH